MPDIALLAELTTDILAAYVTKNAVRPAELPALIASIHGTLAGMADPATAAEPVAEPLKPFVSIKKSVTDDYLISLEDGRHLKSLKRYLSSLGMTPDDYRRKWDLPKDYPMVAPAYAAKRSAQAKSLGLGRKPKAR